MTNISRRRLLATTGAGLAAATVVGRIGRAQAVDPIKTAAIYTVPIEQQWVSRIHLAANTAKDRGDIEYVFSESVANTDYERVMREYAEAGHTLIIGEA
ncbi:MAG: BMP family ABC transporter substrate-binding protein, partial [Rhodospirillales bacterium]|nr:BMP family ABC transporter substrate-binding protein [Rhodospirillales bacterium]